jgi:hypothetical protein
MDASGTLGRRATGAANDSTKLFDKFELEEEGERAPSALKEGTSMDEDHIKEDAVSTSISSTNGPWVMVWPGRGG